MFRLVPIFTATSTTPLIFPTFHARCPPAKFHSTSTRKKKVATMELTTGGKQLVTQTSIDRNNTHFSSAVRKHNSGSASPYLAISQQQDKQLHASLGKVILFMIFCSGSRSVLTLRLAPGLQGDGPSLAPCNGLARQQEGWQARLQKEFIQRVTMVQQPCFFPITVLLHFISI